MDATDVAVTEEPSKLEALYREHAPRALALAWLLTADWHLAEDLVQDAFVRVAGLFGHLRDPANFEGYLRKAVVNLHRSVLRRRRLERAFLARRSPARGEVLPDVESRDELMAALLKIPPRQRAAVVLRHCLDRSEAQVADELRCSVAAARNLVSRGLKSLRTQMKERSDG
jgi:RNA polymerase sigma-70 factor (sigma-E family)